MLAKVIFQETLKFVVCAVLSIAIGFSVYSHVVSPNMAIVLMPAFFMMFLILTFYSKLGVGVLPYLAAPLGVIVSSGMVDGSYSYAWFILPFYLIVIAGVAVKKQGALESET